MDIWFHPTFTGHVITDPHWDWSYFMLVKGAHVRKNPIVRNRLIVSPTTVINPVSPSDAYMRKITRSSSAHIMACRFFTVKPLPGPKVVIGPSGTNFTTIKFLNTTWPMDMKTLSCYLMCLQDNTAYGMMDKKIIYFQCSRLIASSR